MRKSILSALLMLPVAAFAQEPQCKHSQPRDLQLDLAGVKAVVFDIGPHELKLDATPNAKAAVHGKACASETKLLEQLKLTQQKSGDKLYVSAKREGSSSGIFFVSNYAYLKLAGTLPDNVAVQLKVGSGDALVTGASILSADVGSGDVEARRIRGLVAAKVGSGDIAIEDAGSLQVISIGSGDLSAKGVKGAAKVGGIGSGDFDLDGAMGNVEIDSIGSGDAKVSGVHGNVSLGSLGSGDFEARDVRGDLSVDSVGSGSVNHNGVTGQVKLPPEN
ncbi:MAG TPA: DUF4097 family beta strand repeat-containing protein [Pseudoxanthomonas sp.]